MKLLSQNELFLLEEVVKKNFSSKYKDSVLGIFWSVLRPLLIMLVMTIVFSTLFHRSILNYPVYLLSGRCILNFFTSAVGISLTSIKNNKNILTRTAAPKYIFILGSVISEFLNFIISVILLVGVMIVTHATFYFTIIPLSIIPIISITIMITGFSLMLSIMGVYYTDIKHLWGVISLVLMYSSAIFYPMDIIPEPYHKYMILNPVYWIIEQFRDTFAYGIIPSPLLMINSLLISLIILVIGIIIYKKYEKKVIIKL